MTSLLKYSLMFFLGLGYGQNTSTYTPKITPSSPETAKFNQFIDTPVGYNTGMPNIDINLGEINIEGVSVPISLSYHSDGIKVDEKATWVGLGWNLNAGYKVSRKENGIPDESRLFWQVDPNSLNSIQGIKNFSDNNAQTITNSKILSSALKKEDTNSDFRPDEFNYSTANSSAKFMFSQLRQKFVSFPINMDKIEVNYAHNNSGGVINNIMITGDSGVKYFYGIDSNSKERVNPLIHNFNYAWNISTIENIKNETISFSYKLYSLQNYERPVVHLNDGTTYSTNDAMINMESSYITEINYSGGKVEFISEINREDLKQYPKLHSIIFKNKFNQIIKTIILNYSYFINSAGNTSSDNFTENSGKRLKLDSIDVFNNVNTEKQSYSFSYYDANIPDRLTGGCDYWGYYNGTIQSGVPSRVLYATFTTTGQTNLDIMNGYESGANKNINTQTFNTFLLKSITYPTGGKQEYVYENNLGKLSSNKEQTFFCLANKYLPLNQELLNQNININGLFSQSYTDGIYFGYPQPSEIVTLNQYEKKYIFRTSFPINNANVKSIGTLYINSLSHNFDKIALGVTNASQLNMDVEQKKYLIKNGVKTLISGGSMDTSLLHNKRLIIDYDPNLLNDNYDTFEIEISFTYNKLLTPQLNNRPFYFNYNLDDVKRDFNQFYNNSIYLVGGARIKEINVSDKNSIIKKRVYKYSDDFSESGLAYFVPSFSQRRIRYIYSGCDASYPNCRYEPLYYWSYSSDGVYNTSNGSNVAYQYVEEQIYGMSNSYLGKSVYEYYLSMLSSDNNYISFNANPYSFINTFDWVNKSLKSKRIYNSTDAINPLVKEEYEYFFKKPNITESVDEIRNDLAINDMAITEDNDNLNSIFYTYNYGEKIMPYFKHFLGFSLPKRKTTTEYFKGIPVINTIDYNYNFNDDLLQLTSQITTNSKGENLTQKFYYPQDLLVEPFMSSLVSQNRIGTPVKTESFNGIAKLAESHTKFAEFSSTDTTKKMYLQKEIFSSKNSNINLNSSTDRKITFDQYDNKGNILQYTLENGTPVSLIWGYNQTQPVAKLDNIAYASISPSLITAIETASNTGTEASLLTALSNLRNDSSLANAMITTYTYIPLVGVSTITDPKGDTITYTYDSFGRLQNVKDKNGNILSENEYHYKN